MTAAPLGVLAGCTGFALFFAAHAAALHFRIERAPSRALARGFVGGTAAACAVAGIAGQGQLLLAEIYALMTVSCLFVLYAPFFFTIHTSLSIGTMRAMLRRGGDASLAELRRSFASPALLEGRLLTLTQSGYLRRDGERFALTPRGRAVARLFRGLKALWRLGPGG